MSEVKTALERFQAYCDSKGIPEKSSLAHIHKIGQFEEHERKELRAAYEALQKENAELKRIQSNDAIDFWNLTEQNAAQAKRISEQQEDNLKQKDLILNFQDQYAKDHAEIESLRKQVEMLLGSARKTVLALAHASIHDPLYTAAYDELSESIKLASKNGE